MDPSEFVIVLSRQRSGTNALRSVLNLHPDIFSLPEVFDNRMTDDWDKVAGTHTFRAIEATYFRFLERHCGSRLRPCLLAEDDEQLFVDFLEYLRCFCDKRYLTIDIKYMSAHHVSQAWQSLSEEPFLFTLIKKHQLRVLNLTRHNLLRYYLSETKAQKAQNWHQFDESVVGKARWYQKQKQNTPKSTDTRLTLDIPELLEALRLCRVENETVERSFANYEHCLTFDYNDMFATVGGPIATSVLKRITLWLGVEARFPRRKPEYKKLSSLSLRETIANYAEVAKALAGTGFEYCLEDERMYAQGQTQTATRKPAHRRSRH